jgi:hypothetical protein
MLAETHFRENHLQKDTQMTKIFAKHIREIREMLTFPSGLNKKAKNHHEYLNKMVILYKYLRNITFSLKLKL